MLRLLSSGYFMSIQDGGRTGYRRFGMPSAGPMDWYAFQAANILVGNSINTPALEIGMPGAVVQAEEDNLFAVCGNGYSVWIDEIEIPTWMTFFARAGQSIEIRSISSGGWVYLAVQGGIAVPHVMGSYATYRRGNLGGLFGRNLADGDCLAMNPQEDLDYFIAGRSFGPEIIPGYSIDPELRVVEGPQIQWLTSLSREDFFSTDFQVSLQSDRMGYRLFGKKMEFLQKKELLSEGMLPGSIQIAGDGQPILMMPDAPTSGGYAKIATIITVDMPLVAQAIPGISRIKFKTITVELAQKLYREYFMRLSQGLRHFDSEGESGWKSI